MTYKYIKGGTRAYAVPTENTPEMTEPREMELSQPQLTEVELLAKWQDELRVSRENTDSAMINFLDIGTRLESERKKQARIKNTRDNRRNGY